MEAIFSPMNWFDLLHDSDLWNTLIILLLTAAALFVALWGQNIQDWRANRQERAKWIFWNR